MSGSGAVVAGCVDAVDLAIEGAVATVTLARPEARNRLSRAMLERIVSLCEELGREDSVRVVVVQGAGSDFSTGVDLLDPELVRIAQEPIGRRRRSLLFGPRVVAALQSLPQLTIAALHGYCLGGAGCLALACDLRVGAADMRFGMPEVRRGMNMSWHSVHLMVAHWGPTRTKELLLTGRELDVETALSWGFVNRATGAGAEPVQAGARAWADELADSTPPIPAAMVKETVNAIANAHAGTVHMDTDQFILTQNTDDFREAVVSFKQKRVPRYKGK